MLATGLAACLEERPRPAPPVLQLTVDRTTVTPPDSVTGSIRVDDVDGIDSVWLSVGSETTGGDGLFERVYSSRYHFDVPTAASGTTVRVTLRARDAVGFTSSRDTQVVVR